MADSMADFLDDLHERGHDQRLERTTARLRFEVLDDGKPRYWRVSIKKGNVTVTRDDGEADVSLRGDQALFDDIVRGKANMMASVIRGALTFEGDPLPLYAFQRLLPGPASSTHPRARAATIGRSA
jgi:predicted lipid carrier protein YhbT